MNSKLQSNGFLLKHISLFSLIFVLFFVSLSSAAVEDFQAYAGNPVISGCTCVPVKDTIIIVEGPADVWKLGDGVVATSGIKYTSAQVLRCVELVKSKNLKRAFILFDTDKEDKRKQAQIQAKKLAENLSTFLNHVEMLTLEKGDPADLTLTEVKELRKSIFGKVFSVP